MSAVCLVLVVVRPRSHRRSEGVNYKLQNPKIVIHTAHTQIAPKENERNTEKIVL